MTCSSSTGVKLMRIESINSVLDNRFIHFEDYIGENLGCWEKGAVVLKIDESGSDDALRGDALQGSALY
jgi:hypothetical protein